MIKKIATIILCILLSATGFSQTIYHNEWIDYSKTYYKMKVMGFGLNTANEPIRSGVVRIPYITLQSAGLSSTPAEHFQLWRDGDEVPIYTSIATGLLGANDYIEFIGRINDGKLDNELYRNKDFQLCDKWSFQTDTAAYFLTVNPAGNNKRYSAANNGVSTNSLAPTPYFMYTIGRYFRNISNGFYASVGENLYSSSYDRGEGWVSRAVRPAGGSCGATYLTQNFVQLHPYLTGPQMTLKINAVGDMQNSRTFKVVFNGDSINTYQMDYINYARTEDYIDVSKAGNGNATVTISNLSPSLCDEMRVSTIEITYPRMFNMDGKSGFEFTVDSSAGGRYLTITNFNHGGVPPVLYDRTNQKRYITDISTPDTIRVVLAPSNKPYDLYISTQSATYYKQINTLEKRNFIDYNDYLNQGNYLIISNPLIYGSGNKNYVEQYRQYRSSPQGGSYKALVIDINELTDQFAWGVKKHPLAIKNFLKYARNNFVDSPKFVFLIGKGVIYNEYRNNESNPLAERLNLVPTWGNPASDNLLVSNNMTALPAIPIGRLSAVNEDEVGVYLQKVKQHDSLQQSPIHTFNEKGWMKKVLQIAGANDITLGNQIDGYLENYKNTISDTSFGANTIDFSKTKDPAGYPAQIKSFKKIYESGASLITYFGHSSNTSLDFNLGDPAKYNNQYKYPIFIANGCSAGNHFLFETNRVNGTTTISEKFILSLERGAVDYIASTHYGVINYLDLYTKNFYKAMGQTRYNTTIGAIAQEAVRASLASTGPNDYFNRVHAEQYALHGDPAIYLNYTPLPDFIIEKPSISVSPSFISVADSMFTVRVKVYNIGKATNEAVSVKITRQTPDGQLFTVLTKTLPTLYYADSVEVKIPIVSNRDKGINKIFASIDENGLVNEITDTNNLASVLVDIRDDEIRPIFPYRYAIINQPNAKLFASTVNPLSDSQTYLMEIDTTNLFNSPFKISKAINSTGGLLTFDPGITYLDNVTYYWRVAPAANGELNWRDFSFIYKSTGGEGFQQGHLYQNLQNRLDRIDIDSTNGNYSFTNKVHNLFLVNSMYPTSGTQDEHFSISVDGTSIIYSACIGSSIIFNVFDSLTFKPWVNTNQPFGAATTCAPGRKYNFEYSYKTAASRKNAMNFLDAIPKGAFVTARIIMDQPYGIYAPQWAADTAINGPNNSLYHRLKSAGFKDIDSFYFPRTWIFVFKKGDTTFTPVNTFSKGVYDRISLTVNCLTPNIDATITSPVFGPAKQWDNITWTGYKNEPNNDYPLLHVVAVRNGMPDTVLYTLNETQHNFNISGVNAALYPRLKLQLVNIDSITATPYQLTKWNVEYTPVAEGAIAPNLYYNIPDTLYTGSPLPGQLPGMLHIGVGFKNVSQYNFDTLKMKIVLYDRAGGYITYPLTTLKTLAAGDSLHIDKDIDVSMLDGWYNLLVYVNPDQLQPEQFTFNNYLYKYIYIKNGTTLSLDLADFNAASEGKSVNTRWKILNEQNVVYYDVEHSTNGRTFNKIGSVIASSKKEYNLLHNNPSIGKNYYRLKIIQKDSKYTYSVTKLIDLSSNIYVKVYPNPVKEKLYITTTSSTDATLEIKVLNSSGQYIYLKKQTGNTSIDVRNWAAGIYLIFIKSGETTQTFSINKQ